MGKTKVIELTAEQRAELEKGYRTGESHCLRTRCQMILLKSEKRTSVEVAEVLGCCEMVVNNWLARYQQEGLKGLATRAGRGRPPILSQQNPQQRCRRTAHSRSPTMLRAIRKSARYSKFDANSGVGRLRCRNGYVIEKTIMKPNVITKDEKKIIGIKARTSNPR